MDTDVSTSMDQLVGLIEKADGIKLHDAAKKLNTDKAHIESWAKMLEKAEVIELHYSVIGGAVMKKGPKFESVIKGTPIEKLPEVLKVPEPTKVKPPPKLKKGAIDGYPLIMKKIGEEERVIEEDLKKLHEEQTKVTKDLAMMIADGDKLATYLETLRQTLQELSSETSTEKTPEKE